MTSTMLLKILLLCWYLQYTEAVQPLLWSRPVRGDCLLGYMTDVQPWVAADGVLNKRYVDINNSIDLSYIQNPEPLLYQQISSMRTLGQYVQYLSLARCGLTKIPLIFQLTDRLGRQMAQTVEYMSFYGNNFQSVSTAGKEYDEYLNATGAVESDDPGINSNGASTLVWSSALERAQFSKIRELDLRACSIESLTAGLFKGLSSLEALYLGENQIHYIHLDAFVGLTHLYHLDFSRNLPLDENGDPKTLVTDSFHPFENLTNLVTLDLSHTKLTPRNIGLIKGLQKSLKSLSLCNTGIMNIGASIFNKTSLEILDISWNNAILGSGNSLRGLEKSLVVLYARDIGLQSMDIFKDFVKLEVLQLSGNEISSFNQEAARSLRKLQILDLDKNRFANWFNASFSLMPNLRLLSLRDNNINVITEQMLDDLMHLDYLALSGNSLVCNCHAKDFYKMSGLNEDIYNDTRIESTVKEIHNTGFEYYNNLVLNRIPVQYDCDEDTCEEFEFDTGRFRLLDHWPGTYTCLRIPDSQPVKFAAVGSCNLSSRDHLEYDHDLNSGRRLLLILLVIPCLLIPVMIAFVFRRNLKYCMITMRNSAMLSLINNKDTIDDGTIFNYDVFVSYCNEDRGWVLDHLLPHIEAECSISACLHERDFQVGLSILENIVSCMDRSRSIMLIISQQFLLSQWCQFEMHLAQHRLLETRREDLILVLLEDIPRRLRPNTLHYLMLTKTYIVWPKSHSERAIFWRRLNKSLISQKIKQPENASLA